MYNSGQTLQTTILHDVLESIQTFLCHTDKIYLRHYSILFILFIWQDAEYHEQIIHLQIRYTNCGIINMSANLY